MNDKLTNDQPLAMRSLIVVFGCLVAFWIARNTLRIERKVLVAQEPPVADVTATEKDADDRSEASVRDAASSTVDATSLDPYQGKTDASTATSARTLPEVPVRSQSDPDEKRATLAKREDEVLALQLELQVQQRELGNDHPKVKATKEKLRVVERWLTDQRKEPQRSMVIKVTGREAKEVEMILQDAYGELANFVSDPTTGNVVITIRQEVKSPVVEKLLNEIWGTATKLNRAQAENDKQTNRNFPDDARDQQYDRAAKELALKARDATPEQRDALRKQLRQITEQQFDHRQKRRQQEFESLGKRLDELRAAQARRQTNRSTIIERHIDELLNPDADLKWDTVDPRSADPTQSIQPGFAWNGAPLDNAATTLTESHPKSASAKKSSTQPTPTYNGMTLEQAMQTMASDRKPEKLVEAILAAYYLQSAADERELAQTVLQMVRFQNIDNSMSSHEAGFVEPLKQLSLAVLMRLPSDLVVEELAAELRAHGTQKSPREFFQYLLQAYSFSGPIYSPIRTANNGMTVLLTVNVQERTDSANRLRESIRGRARTIARCIAEIARQEPKVNFWAVRCGMAIAEIIKQPISTFKAEFAPIAERVFDDLIENPSGTIVRNRDLGGTINRDYFPLVLSARLLAGCNRRTDDVTKFAMSQIEIWQQGLEKEAKDVQQDIGIPKAALNNAVEIFLAFGPDESNASQQLVSELRSVWDRSKPQAIPPGATEIPQPKIYESVHQYSVAALVDAMGQLGVMARDAIPILQEISESLAASEVTTGNYGFNAGRKWRKDPVSRRDPDKLSEFAEAAIQAIEEAKPAEPPEALPEDTAGSETISRAETQRGAAEDGRSEKSNSASSDDTQPTFKGMTLDQAVRLMTTDRDPEKLIDAVLAAYHLHESGDTEKMSRIILRMMRHQSLNIWAGSGTSATVLGQASTALLMRFPSDVVINEFLSELRSEGARKSSREFFELFLLFYPGIENVYAPSETTTTSSKILLSLNRSEVSDSSLQLDDSIRRKARTFVRLIASIAEKDPRASWWAVSCGSQIAKITKQPKVTFEAELGPIAERILDAPEEERVRQGATRPDIFRSVVKLLAESNRRSDDVMKIAKQKMEAWKQSFEFKSLNQEEREKRLHELRYAEDILVSMSSRAEESVAILNESLEFALKHLDQTVLDQPELLGRRASSGSRMNGMSRFVADSASSLVDTMARVGHPAKSQIPNLKKLEEIPVLAHLVVSGNYGHQWPTPFQVGNDVRFNEFLAAAIRAIEEAKPVEPPKPLPEDVAVGGGSNGEDQRSSNQATLTDRSSAATTGQPPVKPSANSEASSTKAGLAGSLVNSPPTPSYNGMTFEQALRIIATDRNTQKLLEAVAAANYLYESDEHQQIIRLMLQMMRHQNGGAAGSASEDLINATTALLLMRCPPETVVEEFLEDTITNGVKAGSTRHFFYSFIIRYRKIQYLYDANQNQSVLLNLNGQDIVSVQTKMDEAIRRKARTLVGATSAIAMREPNAANWALDCGFQIAIISKQPMTTFESELAQLAERLFDAFDVRESALGFNTQVQVVQLLGACNRRTVDLKRFVDQKVKVWKETFDDENLSEVTSFNRRGALRLAVEALVAIAPQAPESIPTISELLTFGLQQVDPSMLPFGNGTPPISKKAGARKGSHRINEFVTDGVFTLVEALARIGRKAESEIESLKRAATDPLASRLSTIDRFRQPWAKSIPRENARVSLMDFIPAAIKAIEEAKPAEPPEPLPEDVAREASPN